jgi:hypothetical protein
MHEIVLVHFGRYFLWPAFKSNWLNFGKILFKISLLICDHTRYLFCLFVEWITIEYQLKSSLIGKSLFYWDIYCLIMNAQNSQSEKTEDTAIMTSRVAMRCDGRGTIPPLSFATSLSSSQGNQRHIRSGIMNPRSRITWKWRHIFLDLLCCTFC